MANNQAVQHWIWCLAVTLPFRGRHCGCRMGPTRGVGYHGISWLGRREHESLDLMSSKRLANLSLIHSVAAHKGWSGHSAVGLRG
jgi:hypothetical protein